MLPFLEPFRYVTWDNVFWVTLIRLSVALFCGGVIGVERGRRRRPAGFRTHMLVCMGATLAMLISSYISMMVAEHWGQLVQFEGQKYSDMSRLGAQVINGIGFLGAGTIIVTGQQEVKGMTTAAGLWASACMGLAIGAGFIEGAFFACVLISLTITVFTKLERFIISRARNVNLYVEFLNVDDLGAIITAMKEEGVRIFDVELQKATKEKDNQGAVFAIRLPLHMRHEKVMAVLAGVENIRAIEEL